MVLVTPRPDIPNSLVVSCKESFSFLWDCDKQVALASFVLFLTIYCLLPILEPLTESGCIAQDGLEHLGSCSP